MVMHVEVMYEGGGYLSIAVEKYMGTNVFKLLSRDISYTGTWSHEINEVM